MRSFLPKDGTKLRYLPVALASTLPGVLRVAPDGQLPPHAAPELAARGRDTRGDLSTVGDGPCLFPLAGGHRRWVGTHAHSAATRGEVMAWHVSQS